MERTTRLRNWTVCVLAVLMVVSMSLTAIQPASGKGPKPQPTYELTDEEKAFVTEVGVGDYEFGIVEKLAYSMGTLPGGSFRPCGSDAEYEAAVYLKAEMESIGLQDVAIEEFMADGWTFRGASVEVVSPAGMTLPASSYGGFTGTSPAGLTAELVDVRYGLAEDFEGKDVSGKIVLFSMDYYRAGWVSFPLYEAELHGAIGAVFDWIWEETIPDSLYVTGACSRPFMAVDIGHNGAAYLRGLLADGEVTVTVKSDVTIDYGGPGHNVVGYLPGTTNPDEYIIIAGHFDKWWYAASDDSAGVARVLGIARAMVESGYQPSRTIVFVALSAEEYGYVESWFAWLQGSWGLINASHSEMIGKTLAYFNCEGGGTKGSTSVSSTGAAETYRFRRGLLGVFDNYFAHTQPWMSYYYPSSASFGTFSTWTDSCSFGVSGVSWMEVKSSRARPGFNYSYHTIWDNLDRISAESLAMSSITSGITMMRLDRSVVIPYSFEYSADKIRESLDIEAIEAAGIDPTPVVSALEDFDDEAERVWRLVKSASPSDNTDAANHLLIETVQNLGWHLFTIGGEQGDSAQYPHEQAQGDSVAISMTIDDLMAGDVDAALKSLEKVYAMYWAFNFEHAVYTEYMVNWLDPELHPLFWAEGRLATWTDVLDEYFSLTAKKVAGITDYSAEILSLGEKYESVVCDLAGDLDSTTATLESATEQLMQVESLLKAP